MKTFDMTEMPDDHRNYLNDLIETIQDKYGDPDFDLKDRIWEMYCNEDLAFDLKTDIEGFEPLQLQG